MPIQGLNGFPVTATTAPASAPVVARPPLTADTAHASPSADEPSAQDVRTATTKANQALASLSATIEFSVDPDTSITVVKLIDRNDQRVLRQVPSREIVEIARALDRVQSLLIHAVA